MKKVLLAFIGLALIAGCSKNTQFTQDLTGTWMVYKYTYLNAQQSLSADSLLNYSITFSSNGTYAEQNIFGTDTLRDAGLWKFQNSYSQLVFSDSLKAIDTFTIFNLTGNSVELLRNGYDRYMRKNQ